MRGFRTPRSSPVRGLLAVLLGFGIAGAAVPAPAAAAESPPLVFELHFRDLVPGEPQTESASFTLSRPAELVDFDWLQRSGVFAALELDTEVCDASGTCVDPDVEDAAFVAGEVTVSVTATMTGASTASTGTAIGRLTFAGRDPAPGAGPGSGPLGGTGVDGWPPVAWALALLALGALALRAGRRAVAVPRGARGASGP